MCGKFSLIHRQDGQQIDAKDKEIKELKQRLSEVLANSKQFFTQLVKTEDMKTELDNVHGKLRQLELCKSSLQTEVQKQMDTIERALTSVSENQELIDKHLANITMCKQELDNCQRKYRAAVEECGVLSGSVESLERQLREKERLLKEQESLWQKEREKLKETLQSKTNEVNCLQEAKEKYEESNHQLTLSNQKLTRSLEEAEAILNVTKSDVSMQMGPSVYLMISLGVQVCPEIRSESVQFRPPTLHSHCQTDPAQNPSKLTQTVTMVPSGRCMVAVQTVRKVLISKGCGQEDVNPEMKDIGSQTIMVSKVAFLKPGHVKRDDPIFVKKKPMKTDALEREKATVQTQKIYNDKTPDNFAGRDGIHDMTTKMQDERDSTGKSESSLHRSFECSDGMVNSTATQLKAKFKGILKAPNDVKGKKTKSKTVNFPSTLETRIIMPSTTDPSVPPKRSVCASPKLKKPPLHMLTSHGNSCLTNLVETSQDNTNIKQETFDNASFDELGGTPPCPISSKGGSDSVSILCSDVRDAFSDLENSLTDAICKREGEVDQGNLDLGVGFEEDLDRETEDINAPSCKKQKRL